VNGHVYKLIVIHNTHIRAPRARAARAARARSSGGRATHLPTSATLRAERDKPTGVSTMDAMAVERTCMITVLANRNGLSCIQAKMIKVAASKTLAEILGELIDPRGEAHSATVYGYKTNMAEQDRVELMLDLSVAEILQCDDTIRKIRFDMCTLAAPQVVQQNASALSILMSGAHAKAKPHFPSADKLVCPGGGQKPKEMYSKLIKILQKDLKVQFRASAQEAGIKVIGDLATAIVWAATRGSGTLPSTSKPAQSR
jgi:hypothetical protein